MTDAQAAKRADVARLTIPYTAEDVTMATQTPENYQD
jgi:predicted dinucleotide-binding enzyme